MVENGRRREVHSSSFCSEVACVIRSPGVCPACVMGTIQDTQEKTRRRLSSLSWSVRVLHTHSTPACARAKITTQSPRARTPKPPHRVFSFCVVLLRVTKTTPGEESNSNSTHTPERAKTVASAHAPRRSLFLGLETSSLNAVFLGASACCWLGRGLGGQGSRGVLCDAALQNERVPGRARRHTSLC